MFCSFKYKPHSEHADCAYIKNYICDRFVMRERVLEYFFFYGKWYTTLRKRWYIALSAIKTILKSSIITPNSCLDIFRYDHAASCSTSYKQDD